MKNKLKVVFDTNIFVNGIFFAKEHIECSKIIDLIASQNFQLLFAQDTIGELVYITKNFVRHHIKNKDDRIEMLKWLMELFYYSTSVNTCDTKNNPLDDESDEMFLRCAIEGGATYLVSDDLKSGLHNEINNEIKIVSSKDFIELMEYEISGLENVIIGTV